MFEGLQPIGPSLRPAEERKNRRAASEQMVNEARLMYLKDGLCELPEYKPLFLTGKGKSVEEAKEVCLSCPVFAECGASSLYDQVRQSGVRATLTTTDRREFRKQMPYKLFSDALDQPDFTGRFRELLEHFRIFRSQLYVNMYRRGITKPEHTKDRKAAEALLRSGIESALTIHDAAPAQADKK
jgi:hypothetical protein